MPFSDDILAQSRQRLESELIEIEKELGISLRPHEKARLWVRDGFWSRADHSKLLW